MLKLSQESIDKKMPAEKLYSLRALRPPQAARILAHWFIVVGFIFFIVLLLPWQQNIRGTGQVTAFKPQNRPQTVETIIAGRIQKWHVQEGQFVNKGDTIISLTEIKEKYFDPEFLPRLQEQILSKEKSQSSKSTKVEALQRQINAIRENMAIKITQAEAKLEAEHVRFLNAQNQFERNKKLFEAGNIPLTKYQDIEYKYQGSRADYTNAQIEMDRVRAEYLDKISKSESDLNSTQAEIFETQAELAKMRNDYSNMLIRNQQYQILAPQNGIIVKAIQAGIGETIKEGEAVCTILPNTTDDIAVEMYVRAMDVPLLEIGRPVRIEFDGWPALQVSGWPSVSVGTFGGVVQVIDYINSRPGEFRILVVPDTIQESWPRQLRQGSGIKGWVMLNDVPVWYEVWRQLNGFPPSLYDEPLDSLMEKRKTKQEDESSDK